MKVRTKFAVLAVSLMFSALPSLVEQAHAQGGTPLWTNRFGGEMGVAYWAPKIAVDRNGNVFITGGTFESNGSEDFVTLAYSNTGIPLWTNYYDGPTPRDLF